MKIKIKHTHTTHIRMQVTDHSKQVKIYKCVEMVKEWESNNSNGRDDKERRTDIERDGEEYTQRDTERERDAELVEKWKWSEY